MRKIPVIEIFGPTIQGEGAVIGQKTMFIRTGGCDYSCKWCDSAFTWNGTEKPNLMTPQEIFDKVLELGGNNFSHVTISGGNPALWKQPMEELIDMFHEKGYSIGLETQGSIWQPWFWKIDDLIISPKPPSSGMKPDLDTLDEIILRLQVRSVNFSIKVVVFDDEDFEFAKMINKRYNQPIFYLSVGNENPNEEGDISPRLLKKLDWLWNKVLSDPEMNNARPLPQLHTLVWANKRGV
jgi:7-carboxy-7-deazaguanine synthase